MAKKTIKAQMKQRRDTKANWEATNPVLLDGELGIVSDDPNLYKVGDGATAWNSLPFRGFDGTLAQEQGTSPNAVISQKVVSEKLTELESETLLLGGVSNTFFNALALNIEEIDYRGIEVDGWINNGIIEQREYAYHTQPLFVKKGQSIVAYLHPFVSPFWLTDEQGSYYEDVGITPISITKSQFLRFSAIEDCYISLSYLRSTDTIPTNGLSAIRIYRYESGIDFSIEKRLSAPVIIPDNSVSEQKIQDNSVSLQKTTFSRLGKNLFDYNSVEQGILYQGSVLGGYNDWLVSDKIHVKPNTNYTISIDSSTRLILRYALYAIDNSIISYNDSYQASAPIYTTANVAYLRISLGTNEDVTRLQIEEGTEATLYESYGYYIDESVLPYKPSDNPQSDLSEGVEISLPDKIYAVVGDTLQLFYNGMIKAVNPFIFNILTNCSKGAMYPRYWQYKPTAQDVGETTFTLKVLDNNRNVICKKSVIIETVAIPVSPASDIHIACFGDSLTAGGEWCHECDRRLIGTGGTPEGKGLSNLTFVGSKEKDGTRYHGGSGWTWTNYTTEGGLAFRFTLSGTPQLGMGAVYSNNGHQYTIIEIIDNTILCSPVSDGTPVNHANAAHYAPSSSGELLKVSGTGNETLNFTNSLQDSSNPLWDYTNNKMTFIPYANEFCQGQIDVVYVFLTWNNPMTNWKTDYSDMITQLDVFAETLHSEFPNARLKLMAVQFPSIKRGMPDYGASGYGHSDTYGMLVSAFNMNKAYQDWCNLPEHSSWCEFVNVASQFDSDYSMNIIEKDVNTRSSIKEYVVFNGVHPNIDGYYQIADVVYRNIVANFCQEG